MPDQTVSSAKHTNAAQDELHTGLKRANEASDIGMGIDALAHVGAAIVHALLAIAKNKSSAR